MTRNLLLICLSSFYLVSTQCFSPLPWRRNVFKTESWAENSKEKDQKKGYQVGDLTKSFLNRMTERINKVTGKPEYQFGDLTKSFARNITTSITGVEKDGYEFGDITKAFVANFTGKEEYSVGDITQEVIRRIQDGEYSVEDLWLAFRVLATIGVNLSPVASIVPMRLLLQLVDFSLTQEVGERVMGVLAKVLDERFKEALTGDKDYQLGDLTKKAILDYIGKDRYEFGDLSKTILNQQQQNMKEGNTVTDPKKLTKKMILSDSVLADLDGFENAKKATET